MRNIILRTIASIVLTLIVITVSAQQSFFTPYDDMPGMIKSYKPAFDSSFPKWGKMLYEYPVNYFEVIKAFQISEDKSNKPLVRYYKIWIRNLSQWTNNEGKIFVPSKKEYFNKLTNLQKSSYTSTFKKSKNDVSDWTFLGPKETFYLNEQGSPIVPKSCSWQVNVYSFDVAETNNNVLYCGTETGFVNKSTNKGESWELSGQDYFFGGGITAVAINPNNSDIVYVSGGGQVHKTTDGGTTWQPLLTESFSADRLIIDKQNPSTIYAASSNGLFVSFDSGETWDKKWQTNTYDIAIKPDDNNHVYALVKNYQQFKVIESNDGGNTFSPQMYFPGNIFNSNGGLLAISQADPDHLLAVMLSSNNTPYLYRGDLSTGFWTLLATGNTNAFPMNNGQGYFDLVLEVSPINADIIFVGTTSFFRSVNGGGNFTALGGYFGQHALHPDFQDIKMLENGETWVSTDGGMYLSINNFFSGNKIFSLNNGLIGSDLWGFDQGWNEDLVVGGRYHNGNTAIADFYGDKALRMGGAESPTGWVIKGKSRHAAFNDLGSGWILPETAEGKPKGRFFFYKYPNMDEYGGRRSNMLFNTNYFGTIYLGEGNGFWKSTDMGKTFNLTYDFGARVRYMELCYSNPDIIYADIVNKGLYKSEDGGQTWTHKPALTNGDYGTYYWRGKTFIAVSPVNENVIYACLQNGTWTADIGKVFKSTDGGDTWEDWTSGLTEYTKSIVVQPDAEGNDIVYLFTNARNAHKAKVYVRKPGLTQWEPFDNNYPAGFYVNRAMPFFRDSKLRVAGTGGVWESPLSEPDFKEIINPWVEKKHYNCFLDTVFFEDHSILNYENANWHWEITPAPAWIDNSNKRNPKVVLGNPGSYTVKMTITKNGNTFEKEIPDMISATQCPSIDDCSNPAVVPKDIWQLLYVDSEETNYPGYAVMAFDNDYSTIWHTRWSTGSDPYPHEIQVDMGQPYKIFNFIYYTRQDGPNGRIKDYELYVTMDTLNWGEPVSIGSWTNTAAPQIVEIQEGAIGQYFKLSALSEVNGNPWASAAEFEVVGCNDITNISNCNEQINNLKAFPVPSSGMFTISLPEERFFHYSIFSVSGNIVKKGIINNAEDYYVVNLTEEPSGIYIINLKGKNGVVYRVKVVKR
jgi:photosystem II stability/assembly factor-like uncharacterized protein